MPNAAIFLCAGSGTRMQNQVEDKVLALLGGKPAILHSLDAFRASGVIRHIVIAYRDDAQRAVLERTLADADTSDLEFFWSRGGKERQDSVFNALTEISLLVEYAFIHDCARPAIHHQAIKALHQAVVADKAAVLAHRVSDTIKKATASRHNLRKRMLRDVPRTNLWAMETPQAFERELITEAYRRLRFEGISVTDDTAAISHRGLPVTLVENPFPNPKLTVPADLPYLEFLISQRQDSQPTP